MTVFGTTLEKDIHARWRHRAGQGRNYRVHQFSPEKLEQAPDSFHKQRGRGSQELEACQKLSGVDARGVAGRARQGLVRRESSRGNRRQEHRKGLLGLSPWLLDSVSLAR